MARRWLLLSVLLTALFVAAGCGGGTSTPPPTTTPTIRVTISPATTNLLVRTARQFTAAVTNASNTAVTYTVLQGNAGGNILNTGEYLAPAAAGVYTVRAASVADPSKFADATVTVRDYEANVTPGAQPADGYDYHTASLLPDDSILVVGGKGIDEPIHKQAQRYVASSNSWQPDASLATARMQHAAFSLGDGKVVISGGYDPNVTGTPFDPVFKSTEVYDPAAKAFAPGPEMNFPRRMHVVTQLKDSRFLITGGIQLRGNDFGATMNTEIYDPTSDTFIAGKTMTDGRWLHTATLLPDGRVLIVGGRNNNCTGQCPIFSLRTAEIFDPATGNFTATGSMTYSRYNHTATLLPDGRVLILGGETTEDVGTGNDQVPAAELYNPVTGTFTTWTNLALPRSSHAVTLLNNGKLWLTGGFRSSGLATNRTELFDPATGVSVEGPTLAEFHVRHGAIRLSNGHVVIVAGSNGNQPMAHTEILK